MGLALLQEEGKKEDKAAHEKKHRNDPKKKKKKKKMVAQQIEVGGPEGRLIEKIDDPYIHKGVQRAVFFLIVIGIAQTVIGVMVFEKSHTSGHTARINFQQGSWWNGMFAIITGFQGAILLFMDGEKAQGQRFFYMNATFVWISGIIGCYGDCQWPNNSSLDKFTKSSCGLTGGVALAHIYAMVWASAWANGTEYSQVILPHAGGPAVKVTGGQRQKHEHRHHEHKHKQPKEDKNADFALAMLNGETPGSLAKKKKAAQKKKKMGKKISPVE